jgi:hypothetical protein
MPRHARVSLWRSPLPAGGPITACIRLPIRLPAVRSIGPEERRTRKPIGTPSPANVSPYAPGASTMANLSAIGVNTSLPCRCYGNHGKAQGCACQETENKLLHCNPRYGESKEHTLHPAAADRNSHRLGAAFGVERLPIIKLAD